MNFDEEGLLKEPCISCNNVHRKKSNGILSMRKIR